MSTVYANLLSCKITPNELVFEFSNFFPDRPNVAPPADLKPEVRVVMNASVLDQLVQYFGEAQKQRNAAVAQSKATAASSIGFVPPTKQ